MRCRGTIIRSRCGWGVWALLGLGLALGFPGAPARAQEDPAQQKISLDLVDADLRDAIALIFKDTPLNHVISDGVYGTGVTLKLDGVPRERALKILLDSKGLTYVKEGGVYMIKPKAGAAPGAGGMGAAPGGMGGPEGGMMPGGPAPAGPGARPASAGGAEGGAAGGARSANIKQIKLTHLDPWYLRAVLYNQLGTGAGGGGQFGGMGGGGMGGFGGGGMMGGMGGMGGGMGGMGGGMGGLGGGMGGLGGGMGGLGGGMGGLGGGMGGLGGGMGGLGGGLGGLGGGLGGLGGGGSFGGGQGQGQSNTGTQVFRPTLRR